MVDGMTEKKIEQILVGILENTDSNDLGAYEVCSYEDRGYLTSDKGVVIRMQNGTEINLTIQAYGTNGRRMA